MKKIISILLTVSVIFGCTILPVYSEAEKQPEPTIEELKAADLANTNEKVDTIFGLGIIDRNPDELMELSGKVTRIDVVMWLYRMFNYSNKEAVPQASNAYFDDISIHHYAAGYIEDMVSRGIVSGYNDNTFRAENVITYDEIKTLLTRAAGYKNEASLNLNVSISEEDRDGITRKTAAEMLYKLMFTKIFPLSVETEYKTSDKEEFIRYIMKLDYVDGILDAAGGVSLQNKSVPKDVISVNGNDYSTAGEFSVEYFGYHGRLYINTRLDAAAVLFCPSVKNNILEITSDQIEKYKNREYSYYDENNKLKRVQLIKGFEDDYAVYNNIKDVGFNQYGQFCYASAYSVNPQSLACDVMVVRKSKGSSIGKDILVFDSIYQAHDEKEGDVVSVVKYMSKGQLKEQKLDKNEDNIGVESLKKGDVVLYSVNNNELILEELIYSSTGNGTLNTSGAWPSAGERHFNISYRVIAGKVAKTDSDIVHVKINDDNMFDEMVKTSNISVYDASTKEMFKSTPNGLRTIEKNSDNADNIIISSRDGAIQEVIVVRY